MKNLANVAAGQTAPKEFADTGIPFVRAGHLGQLCMGGKSSELPRVTHITARKCKLKLYPKGSLVFAKSGMSCTKNRIWVLDDDCYVVSHLCVIEPLDDQLDVSYALRFFQWFGPSRLIKDEAYPSISLKDVNSLEIPLPPLEEQKRIAEILDEADRVRKKTQALIDKYDELAQSLFLDMFGDPVTNPKGWEMQSLGDSIEFLTSGSRGWGKFYASEGALFLRIGNVGSGRLLMQDVQRVQAPDGAESRRTSVRAGDVLLSITADLGRAAVVTENLGQAHINQHLALIRLDESLNPVFLTAFLTSKGGKQTLLLKDKGGVKSGLNFDDIRSLNVFSVSRQLQDAFGERLGAIEEIRTSQENQFRQDDVLFEALLQKAFKGELT